MYRSNTRKTKQQAADDLDLMVFRTIGALLQFADDHKDRDVREMGYALGNMRHHVRKHMHADARAKTAGAA